MKEEITLGFGRFAATPLSQVPARYKCWVLDNCSWIGPTMREIIRADLGLPPEERRQPHAVHALDPTTALRILARWVKHVQHLPPDFVAAGESALQHVLRFAGSPVDIH